MPERAQAILTFVISYKQGRGVAPTYREIGAACGINSTSLVRFYLDTLVAAGQVVRLPGTSRGILLAEEARARGL